MCSRCHACSGKVNGIIMVTSVPVTGKDIESLKEVLSKYHEFNVLNGDLYGTYVKKPLIARFQFRNGIRLIRYNDTPALLIWSEPRDYSSKIRSIIPFEFLYTIKDPEFFREIIFNFRSSLSIHLDIRRFEYMAVINDKNEKILTDMGFLIKKGILVMQLNLDNIAKPTKTVQMKKFQIENIRDRVAIQNNIFNNKNRVPINTADIFMEVSRKSYIPELSFFLLQDDQLAGYGQVTKHNNRVFLVNFGITDEYRGKGMSRDFLLAILKETRNQGYDEIFLEVHADNDKAVNLYLSVGFTVSFNTATWVYLDEKG